MQFSLASFILLFAGSVDGAKLRSTPDVSEKVKQESQENFPIHEIFETNEQEDEKREQQLKKSKDMVALHIGTHTFVAGKWVVALDKDLKTKMLVQIGASVSLPELKDPCANIPCAGNLKCPAGFAATSVPGHCCAYCVNPDVKIETAVTGATGSSGGKASTFCPKVWCFPTMCTKGLAQPNSANGQCCPMCPAL